MWTKANRPCSTSQREETFHIQPAYRHGHFPMSKHVLDTRTVYTYKPPHKPLSIFQINVIYSALQPNVFYFVIKLSSSHSLKQ